LTDWNNNRLKKGNMVKKIVFYDKDEAIRYQVEMRRQGYVTKIIHPGDKYEVIVAGEAPEWKQRTDWSNPE